MAYKRNNSIQACRTRVARLSDAGSPATGPSNLYVTDALIKIDYKIQVEAGANIVQVNGCGDTCLTFRDRDKITGVDVSMDLCLLDAELMELLTGSPLITVGGAARGNSLPASGTALENDVSVEVWSRAWAGDQQATSGGNLIWMHWVWPSSTWRYGDGSLANAPFVTPVVGKSRSNALFMDGPGNDVPTGQVVGAMGWFETTTQPPAVTNGYAALVGS